MSVTTAVPAETHRYDQRGFTPGSVYQFNDVDHVSLLGGGLTVTVPIGSRFALDGGMSYGFTLVYGSKLYDTAKAGNPQGFPASRKIPNPRSSAGLGWSLTLGRLYPPDTLENDADLEWLYVSPDGGEHYFYPYLHGTVSMPGAEYTRDGSFLRMKVISPSVREVEQPDGTVLRFEQSTGWRLTQMRNRYPTPATVTISYATPGQWVVTDSAGRTHRVYLSTFDYGEPGLPGQSAEMVTRVELAAFGDHPATYDLVYFQKTDLMLPCAGDDPDFAGPISVPLLTEVKVPDDDDPTLPGDPQSSWEFQYYYEDSAPFAECRGGALQQVELPTEGTIDYEYQRWLLPVQACADPWDPWRDSTGISARTVTPGFNQPAGTWTYSRTFSDEPGSASYCPSAPPGIPIPPEEMAVTVTSPLGDETVNYFSVWPGTHASPRGFLVGEFGEAFTRAETDGSPTPRYLSKVVCEGPCAVAQNVRRKEYVRFEGGAGLCDRCVPNNVRLASERKVFLDDAGHHRSVDRSDYDGLSHYRVETVSGDFVTGHTRSVTTSWNASRGTYPDSWVPPASTDSWVLETFTSRKTEETSVEACGAGSSTEIAWQESCFDDATGFLARERTISSGQASMTRGASDAVHVYEQDPAAENGNARFERWYGGDGGGLGTSPLCSLALPAASYSVYHEYQAGVRAKSRFTDADANPGNDGGDPAFAFWTLDQTIDADSGLASSTRDVSGLQTNLEYDRLGRPTAVKPTTAHGGAWQSFAYPRASGGTPAKARREVWENGGFTTLLGEEQTYFDGLGRPARERRKRHDGQFDERYSFYNANGWKAFLGEWARSSAASYGVSLDDFDPFGRARSLFRDTPGGHVLEASFEYLGDRQTKKTTGVGSVLGGGGVIFMEAVDTWERFDHHGRLVEAQEPSDGTSSGVTTFYGYDVGNRLKKARTDAPAGTPDQTRCWTYDRRGFLTSEQHPEKGAAGNGSVTCGSYDALGNVGTKTDSGMTLDYEYDPAGRLELLKEASAGDRTLKEWVFASGNGTGNQKKGKVEIAHGWNYLLLGGILTPLRFQETFTYGGPGGMLTARDVQMFDAGANSIDRFAHAESFDDRGQRIGVAYPLCVVIPGRESICPPEAQVSFSTSDAYSYGFLTQVASWAPAISYHANGLWSSIQHGNGVTDAQYLTPKATGGALDHRPRPRLLKATAGATTLWSSGSFVYDYAGNITALGEPDAGVGELNHLGGVDRFLYDRVQRLQQGWLTVPEGPAYTCLFCDEFETSDVCEWDASEPPTGCLGKPGWPGTPESALFANRTQAYGFDVYGNIQSITTDGVAVTTTADPATNRLTGTGTGYDDRGNLAQRAGVTFTYDALNRMTKRVASGETSEYYFLYTADDERILTFVDRPAGDEFRWSLRDFGGKVLRDYVSTSSGLRPATDYVFRGSSLVGARDYQSDLDGAIDLHYTLDHLGTPRLITNQAGAVVDERKYFPFGEEAKAADAEGPRLRFTGHERDVFNPGGAADDLDDLHARFRSPLTGRFLSVDPVLQAKRTQRMPQLWNRYAYGVGNPLKFIDPTGETISLVFDFSKSGLSPTQRAQVIAGIKAALVKAGVKDVRVYHAGGSFRKNNLGGSDATAFIAIQQQPLDTGGFGETDRQGAFGPLSNTSRVSLSMAPAGEEQRLNFLVNVGAHELGHGSRALSDYDFDSWPGWPSGRPGSIMEQVTASPAEAELFGRGPRGFSPEDSSRLMDQLNGEDE